MRRARGEDATLSVATRGEHLGPTAAARLVEPEEHPDPVEAVEVETTDVVETEVVESTDVVAENEEAVAEETSDETVEETN